MREKINKTSLNNGKQVHCITEQEQDTTQVEFFTETFTETIEKHQCDAYPPGRSDDERFSVVNGRLMHESIFKGNRFGIA